MFLPIAGRELRVNARKRSTFRVRVAGALIALVIGVGIFAVASISPSGSMNSGSTLFTVLTWLCLGGVLSAGLFFTSDCLSEEKREGTLGFLFLTDLRGYDVASGKLLAASLRGFYALLAVFPVVAVTFLMGGVTGAAFWKSSLALVNALLASLAAGLFVSTLSRDAQKSLGVTLLLLILWVAAGPVADGIWAATHKRAFAPVWSVSSPGYLLASANAFGRTPFWWGLLLNQAIAWTFFGLSCGLVSRTWQDKKRSAASAPKNRWRLRAPRKVARMNPVVWLASRERWQTIAVWLIAIPTLVSLILILPQRAGWFWMLWSAGAGLLTLILYGAIASQAAQLFVDTRRTGLLELLLATPLTSREIVQGQWLACVRRFALPLLIFLAAQAIGSFMVQQETAKTLATIPPPAGTNAAVVTNTTMVRTTPGGTTVTVGTNTLGLHRWVAVTVCAAGALAAAANFAALTWFGMWMGLTSKKSSTATLLTIIFVQIVPWLAASFAAGILVPLVFIRSLAAGQTQMMVWYPLLTAAISTLLYLGKDLAFCLWSRKKLYADFRERAAGLAPARRNRGVTIQLAPSM